MTALHKEGIYSHSQPIYEDSLTEEILETDQQAPEKSQDFSPKDKIVNRHKIRYTATRIKYSPTRIKCRHFLSNISYTGISKSYFYNENCILDVFVLIVKNLNPFSLSRKITDKTKHEMVYMFWRECVPSNFIDTSAKRRIFFISAVEMLVNRPSLDLSIRKNRIFECFKNIWCNTNTSVSMFIRMFFSRCTPHPRREVSI